MARAFRYMSSTRDSSVGRAEDCSGQTDILRSAVRLRLAGTSFFPSSSPTFYHLFIV